MQDTESELFVVRNPKELRSYLFESEYGFVDPSAGRSFDLIDVILINGDAAALPWSKNNIEMYVLLKMCIKVKKPVFATSGAMLTLLVLCVTDLETVNKFNNRNLKF